MIKEKHPT